jgi:hypothetical protein
MRFRILISAGFMLLGEAALDALTRKTLYLDGPFYWIRHFADAPAFATFVGCAMTAGIAFAAYSIRGNWPILKAIGVALALMIVFSIAGRHLIGGDIGYADAAFYASLTICWMTLTFAPLIRPRPTTS